MRTITLIRVLNNKYMNLEQQCVSLELAKKLKELGVKQESLYWWSEHTIPATLWAGLAADDNAIWNDMQYSAFTVAELLQMLKEPVLVPVDGSAADYLAGLIINMHKNGERV